MDRKAESCCCELLRLKFDVIISGQMGAVTNMSAILTFIGLHYGYAEYSCRANSMKVTF